jgi:hypothetical protein
MAFPLIGVGDKVKINTPGFGCGETKYIKKIIAKKTGFEFTNLYSYNENIDFDFELIGDENINTDEKGILYKRKDFLQLTFKHGKQ